MYTPYRKIYRDIVICRRRRRDIFACAQVILLTSFTAIFYLPLNSQRAKRVPCPRTYHAQSAYHSPQANRVGVVFGRTQRLTRRAVWSEIEKPCSSKAVPYPRLYCSQRPYPRRDKSIGTNGQGRSANHRGTLFGLLFQFVGPNIRPSRTKQENVRDL